MGVKGANRRRRAGIWITGLAVIAAIAATYHLTRPPELVWWTSPPIPGTAMHVHLRVPYDWEQVNLGWSPGINVFELQPTDRRPRYLRWLTRRPESPAFITISTQRTNIPDWIGKDTVIESQPDEHGERAVSSS